MSSYIISPTAQLSGSISISGSKNSSLPILAASLLSEGTCIIKNIPDLSDTRNMCSLLECAGAECTPLNKNTVSVTPKKCQMKIAPFETVCKLRASFLIIGPVLARYGQIKIPLPGGCQIGARPINLHLKGFEAMGAKISQGHGYVELKCKKLGSARIYLDFPSVGATENIMIAASLSDGEVVIENAANEPEIIDLANFLCSMGGEIYGAGTDKITIKGKPSLHPTEYSVIPDRIEAGTFLTMAVACRSKLTLKNVIPDHLSPIIAKLNEMGVGIKKNESTIEVLPCDKFKAVDIKTLPHPGFPTDMQSQFMSLLSIADGTGVVVETVFENRFMQVPELLRMGANIKVDGRTAVIDGTRHLSGAKVRATDLRAGAALVIAALSSKGQSEICDIEHIERGYENFEQKLSELGVNIKKV